MKRALSIAALMITGAAALLPLAASADSLRVYIGSEPPAARYERVPPPRHGYVWAPGYWDWEHNRHAWRPGHWERARDGYHYRRHEWQRGRDGYYLSRGGWEPVYRGGHGHWRDRDYAQRYRGDRYYYRDDRYRGRDRGRRDLDHDGVPDAYDRDLDNDGVSNRYDRDRDGDGVRNDRDYRPNNPYRD